jgi:hypothetical protein
VRLELPKRSTLQPSGETPAPFMTQSCFMGAGTPVHVFDLETGTRRPATRKDVRRLVMIQDALPHVDIVRPTVTATDQVKLRPGGNCRTAVSRKPIVHRTFPWASRCSSRDLRRSRGETALRAPNFATVYCPISRVISPLKTCAACWNGQTWHPHHAVEHGNGRRWLSSHD